MLSDKITSLLSLFEDPSKTVRKTASWVFSKIASNVPVLIGDEDVLAKLYDLSMQGIKQDKSEVACIQSGVISNIAKNFAPGMANNFFSSRMEQTIDLLLELGYNTTNEPVNNDFTQNGVNAFATIYTLIEKIPTDCNHLFTQYIEKFYEMMKSTLDPTHPSSSRKEEFQGYFCLALQTIFQSAEIEIGIKPVEMIIDLITDCFKDKQDVFEEAFMLISSLCGKYQGEMDRFVEQIGPYIFHSLDDPSVSKSAASLISDLCTMVESKNILGGFRDYTPKLLSILRCNEVEREGKLSAITALADTITATQADFDPFFNETLTLFSSAA